MTRRHRSHRHAWQPFGVALLVAATLGACTSGPSGPDLAKEPALAIDIPGAVELEHHSSDPTWSVDGGASGALASRSMVAEATRDEVFAYYDQAFRDLGWVQSSNYLIDCSGHFTGNGWVKDEMAIGISFIQTEFLGSRDCGGFSPKLLEEHETAFELILSWSDERERHSYAPPPPSSPDPALEVLRSMPEWDLRPEGAEQIHESLGRSKAGQPAEAWRRYRFESGDAPDVLAYYGTELAHRGWVVGSDQALERNGRTDLQVCGWTKAGVRLVLRLWDPDAWHDIFENLPYRTVFEVKLTDAAGDASGEGCDPARS